MLPGPRPDPAGNPADRACLSQRLMQVGGHCQVMVCECLHATPGLHYRPVIWFTPLTTGQVVRSVGLRRSTAGFQRSEAVYDAAQLVGRLPKVLDQVPPRRIGAFCYVDGGHQGLHDRFVQRGTRPIREHRLPRPRRRLPRQTRPPTSPTTHHPRHQPSRLHRQLRPHPSRITRGRSIPSPHRCFDAGVNRTARQSCLFGRC
jgi:hypothetical protein